MTTQKSDLIRGERKVYGSDAAMLCQCGADAEPFSCYCATCEAREFDDDDQDA